MELTNTIIGALGDALVAITVFLALHARRDARSAEARAEEGRKSFAMQQRASLQETELVRRRQRVQEVGAVTEKLVWSLTSRPGAPRAPADLWMQDRNRLAQLMVGLNEALPSCAAIVDAASPSVALESAKYGRQEVLNELERIDMELRNLHSPTIPPTIGVDLAAPAIATQGDPARDDRSQAGALST